MRRSPLLAAAIVLSAIGLDADSSPALQWVITLGGSGASAVAGAAADSHGNLYIAGSTYALDFPTVAAAQSAPGGSTLVRIPTATGVSDKLYPPGLSAPTSLAADPRNPQSLYATAGYAIWRSTDAGTTWSILYQFASTVTAEFVAVDPSNSNTLYAGTVPLGIFKSTDAGLTWTAMNSGIAPATDGTVDVYYIAVDPNSPRVVFAGAGTGLMRSPDGGSSWTLVATPYYYSNRNPLFGPFSPGTVYLATDQGIDKSTDDGQTFTPLSQLPDQSPPNVMAADPLHAGILYAGSYSGIYQSVDSGRTWTQKNSQPASLIAADPNNPVLYAADYSTYGILKSTDGFTTTSTVGPPEVSLLQLLVAGSNLFLVASPSHDVFVAKLDPNGNIVYSTYLGGSADDTAVAIALGSDGSVYVTGATRSTDFPVTAGAYGSTNSGPPANFVFKLNPDGSLAWASYFASNNNTVNTIAVDAAGSPYIAGVSFGYLPTTPGAYQTQFQYMCEENGFFCGPGFTSAFVTKFNGQGTGLVYSTYVPTDSQNNVVETAQALGIDSNGNAFFGGNGNVVLVNATGSALLASTVQPGLDIAAMALDSGSDLYATGTWNGLQYNVAFPATPAAFQPAPPAILNLPDAGLNGGGSHAFVMKWDSRLSRILAATLLAGESAEFGECIAIDGSGNVIVGGFTDSRGFPTHAPFQTSFSAGSGFVAGLDSGFSNLLFSTYLGDTRPFNANAALPDGSGNILLAGSTLPAEGSYSVGGLVVANKIALPPAPAARLDTVVNYASRLAAPLAPGEAIAAIGAGFGPDAQLLVDGVPLAGASVTATTISGTIPDGAKTSGAFQVQVSTGGTLSNPVNVPAAPASPGIYSVDGSGYNQGYIRNSDGTLNSPSNPAAVGSAINIFATGAGAYTLSGPYAVTALAPSVFVGGFYADGIAAVVGPVAGLPGNVYQISVYVPNPAGLNPDLRNNPIPPQQGVTLVMGPVNPPNFEGSSMISQPGLVLNVKP
ncbi:MAG: hypothetical protein ABSH56_10340 [Bryobacteraceae bacterium]|jgi:uncharacterized protein (TIGR03437 family)